MKSPPIQRLFMGIFLLPMSAHADWQYARWGMTASEVVVASSGAATAAADPYAFPDGRSVRATGKFTSSAGSFEVDFVFDAGGGLAQVNLAQHSVIACGNTLRLLTEKYSAPASPNSTTSVWQDRQSGNVIVWSDTSAINRLSGNEIEPDCVVTYKPLGKGDSGL